MQFIKKLLLGAVVGGCCWSAAQAELAGSVDITSTDNKSYTVQLTQDTHFSFNEEANFIVYSYQRGEDGYIIYDESTGSPVTETLVEFPGENLAEMVFKAAAGGVHSPSTGFHFCYDLCTGVLTVSGSEHVSIYSATGVLEGVVDCNGEDTQEIDMRTYGTGTHIVKVGSESIKLLVK